MIKKESSFLQLALPLTLVSAFAGLILAVVFSKTVAPIEAARAQKKQDAIVNVLPGFDIPNGRIEKTCLYDNDKDSVCVFLAYSDTQLFGAAVETYTHKSFSGTFTLMVGFDKDGKILQIQVLQAHETPGLGDNINNEKSNFAQQFIGKSPASFKLDVVSHGGDIAAITAATITSRAYCEAVERAHHAFLTIKEQKETIPHEE